MSDRTTGATDDQIAAAKDWTADYLNVLIATGRAIAVEAVRVTVPVTHRIVAVDDIRAALAMIWPRDHRTALELAAIERLQEAIKS